MSDQATKKRLKELIITELNLEGMTPEMIDDDDPLFGGGLGLDSVDALELVLALEKEYGLKIEGGEQSRQAFASISSLAELVEAQRAAAGGEAEA